MRIAFITNSLGFGGAEKMLAFIASRLADRGHACSIINLNAFDGAYDERRQPVSANVKIYELAKPNKRISRHLFRLKEIYSIAKAESDEVLVGFTCFPNMYASIVAKALHIKSIMSERGDPAKTEGNYKLKNALATMIINSSDGGVFQTPGAAEYYGNRLRNKSAVIANPIYVKDNIPKIAFCDREKTVVSVGRLDNEQKRYDVMLKAFDIFLKNYPDYKLLLYGRGGDEEQIKTWVSDMGLSESVIFKGLSSEPMVDISNAGIFLITSDYEGISNSLLEAMAVGLPCVSTDHTPGGARLLIQDHHNGLLAPIGDYEAIAKGLCEFAGNSDLSERCGNEARKVTERFSPDEIINQWENYFKKIANNLFYPVLFRRGSRYGANR